MLSLLGCRTSDLKCRESRPRLVVLLKEKDKLYSASSPSIQVYKWVTPTYCWGRKHPVQGEEGIPSTPTVLLKPGCVDSSDVCRALVDCKGL